MSQIDELISKLQEVSNHPQKTVLNYKKQGKGLVGMMPYYAPEEIVYAAGYLPVGMFGSQNPQISAARTYLPPFACSLMQADRNSSSTAPMTASTLLSSPFLATLSAA